MTERGARCGFCYWALYDGDWCQNPDCVKHGQSIKRQNIILLTTYEAYILINSEKENDANKHS